MLVLAGGGVGGPEESDDGNIDTTTIRQVAPVTQYTPLHCPGPGALATHILSSLLPPLINISKITIQPCRFRVNICWHLAFNHESLATIFFSYMDIRIGKLSPIKI